MGKAKSRARAGSRSPSQRQLRVGELLRHALAEILSRGEHHIPDLEGYSITVTQVQMSPDLRNATAYIMPLGGAEKEQLLALLESGKGQIRGSLARKVKLRHAPNLKFVLDATFDNVDHIGRLLRDPRVATDLNESDPADPSGEGADIGP